MAPKDDIVSDVEDVSEEEMSENEGGLDMHDLAYIERKRAMSALANPQRTQGPTPICEKELLQLKFEEIEYKAPKGMKRVPWIETLVIPTAKAETAVGDDVKREAAFHERTAEAVKEAYRRLHVMGVDASRPNDFYAEMMKSDYQMLKIRQNLTNEQKKIAAVEQRKKNKTEKKFAKEVQSARIKEKQAEKVKRMENIEKFKAEKRSRKHDDGDEGDFEGDFQKASKADGKGKGKGKGKDMKPGKKREAKNARYGFGGKKAGSKRNTRDSTDDFSMLSRKERKGKLAQRAKKAGGKGKGKGKGKGGGKGARKGGKFRK